VANIASLNEMLRNPVYLGTLRYGGRDYPHFCPPLVSAETWAAVQAVNQARADRFGYDHPRRTRSRFLLTGLLLCSVCGSRMNGRVTKKPTQPDFLYYACRHSTEGQASRCRAPMLPKAEIEEKVFAAIEKAVLRPEVLHPLLEMSGADRERREGEHARTLRRLQKDLARTNAELARLVAAIRAAGHSDALVDELHTLEHDRAQLTAQLVKANASAPAPIDVAPGELEHALSLIRSRLRGETADSLTVLRGLVVEIHARREGGSPIKHRLGELVGEITVRLPLVADQTIVVPL